MSGRGRKPSPRRRQSLPLIFTAAVIWLTAIALGVLAWWPAAIAAAICGTAVVSTLIYQRIRWARRKS